MRTILITLPLILMLQQPAFADVVTDYYVSPSGSDANTCTEATHPCKTVKGALDNTQTGFVSKINITNGSYEEECMKVKDNQYVQFEGGWDSDFIQQTCNPSMTVIKTGNSTTPHSSLISNGNSSSDNVRISLHCLTLAEVSAGNIDIAVSLWNTLSNKIVEIDFDHVHVHGFTNQALRAESRDGGKIAATLSHSTFDNNPAEYGVLSLVPKSDGTIELNMDHVYITNNGTSTTVQDPVGIYLSGTGNITTSIQNSIIAGNQVNGNAAIDIQTRGDSNSTFTMINTTVVNNSRIALALFASNNSHNNVSLQNNILLLHTLSDDAIYLYQNDQSWISLNANYCIVGRPWTSGDTSHIAYHSTHEVHGNPRLSSTYHLQKGSPAIDAGICGEWINIWGYNYYDRIAPLDDIDGDKRPGDWALVGCDIGADEYKPFSWPMFLPAITHHQ